MCIMYTLYCPLESTQRVETLAKNYVLFRNVKLYFVLEIVHYTFPVNFCDVSIPEVQIYCVREGGSDYTPGCRTCAAVISAILQ